MIQRVLVIIAASRLVTAITDLPSSQVFCWCHYPHIHAPLHNAWLLHACKLCPMGLSRLCCATEPDSHSKVPPSCCSVSRQWRRSVWAGLLGHCSLALRGAEEAVLEQDEQFEMDEQDYDEHYWAQQDPSGGWSVIARWLLTGLHLDWLVSRYLDQYTACFMAKHSMHDMVALVSVQNRHQKSFWVTLFWPYVCIAVM